MKKKLTKEMAKQKMDSLLGEDKFELIEWNGTNKAVKLQCKLCGNILTFKNGQTIYAKKTTYGGFNGECNKCNRYKFAFKNIETYKTYIKGYQKLIEQCPENKEKYMQKIKENKLKIEKEKNIINSYENCIDKS